MSGMGHSRPMHSVPLPINVRCYSNSDIIVRRIEMTLRAKRRHVLDKTTANIKSAPISEAITYFVSAAI
jgi:hypothetical protein